MKMGEPHWYVLNETPGMETIYFVAARERNLELEALYEKLKSTLKKHNVQQLQYLRGPTPHIESRYTGPPLERKELFRNFAHEIEITGVEYICKVQFRHE
jgi:hypothetical protein